MSKLSPPEPGHPHKFFANVTMETGHELIVRFTIRGGDANSISSRNRMRCG
ncbi:MAG: hypothetical protein GY826_25785 [Fuerstiella sp.]|nr:hypothetical protein [Fuerstiella sp.]